MASVDRVVFDQVRERFRRITRIDGDHVVTPFEHQLPKYHSADSTKSIDCNFRPHTESPFFLRYDTIITEKWKRFHYESSHFFHFFYSFRFEKEGNLV